MSDTPKIDNGGPAFPIPFIFDQTRGHGGMYIDSDDAGVPKGMTLRDWFAGQALGAYCCHVSLDATKEDTAIWAYQMADAMIAARKDGGA